jgi:hypothetical protein
MVRSEGPEKSAQAVAAMAPRLANDTYPVFDTDRFRRGIEAAYSKRRRLPAL